MSDVDCVNCGRSWETSYLLHAEVYRVVASTVTDLDARERLVAQWQGELGGVVDVPDQAPRSWAFQEVGWVFARDCIYVVLHCPDCPEGVLPDPEVVWTFSVLAELFTHERGAEIAEQVTGFVERASLPRAGSERVAPIATSRTLADVQRALAAGGTLILAPAKPREPDADREGDF